jgi:Tol biopolymer transport system component
VIVSPRKSKTKWVAVGALLPVALGVLAYLFRPALPPPRITGYTQLTHDGQQKSFGGQVTAAVLTDGPRLFVQENINGRFVITQVGATGGEPVVIPIPFQNVSLLNISPDRSSLLVGSFTGTEDQQPIWMIPALGGSPKRMTDQPAGDGTWMPNGNFMFSANQQLFELGPEGKHKTADLPGLAYWFRWSPDGKVVRFTVSERTNTIWEANADGTRVHRFLSSWRNVFHGLGNFTPDGKYYIFETIEGSHVDLWVTREKGDFPYRVSHEPMRLTSGPLNFTVPQPSLDGKKIFAVGEQQRAELMRYDAKAKQFVPYLGGASVSDVSFSPDGEWVAYVSYPERNLWRSRKDGSERLQLTSGALVASLPRWSPDGKQIAFSEGESGKSSHISVISAAGGDLQIVPGAEVSAVLPSWSADGKAILFVDANSPGEGKLRRVELGTGGVSDVASMTNLFGAVCSPDGRYCASSSSDGTRLMLLELSSGKWNELANVNAGWVTWSRDSKYLYFDSGFGQEAMVRRLRLSDRKIERVADLKGFRRVVFLYAPWLGVTPEGEPLLLHDISTQEVYALDFEEP